MGIEEIRLELKRMFGTMPTVYSVDDHVLYVPNKAVEKLERLHMLSTIGLSHELKNTFYEGFRAFRV